MSLKITEKAHERLKERLSKEYEDSVARVVLNGFGWGGPSFGIVLDIQKKDDYVIDDQGLKVVAENNLINQFNGFTIDYMNSWLRKGFVVSANMGGSKC